MQFCGRLRKRCESGDEFAQPAMKSLSELCREEIIRGVREEAVASDRISVSEDIKVKLDPAPVNLELLHDEAVALRNRTQDMTTANSRRRWGPRAIRSFKFRYMLARELLRELGEPPVDPQLLTEKLLEAMQRTSTKTPESADSELLDRIVDQVA